MNREEIQKAIDLKKDNKIISKYGIKFLDDLLLGILSNDFILLMAESGVGKTELCISLMKECSKTCRVKFLALEADEGEPIQRLDFRNKTTAYWKDPNRINQRIDVRSYISNEADLDKYEKESINQLEKDLKNITITYKGEEFNISTLTQLIGEIKDDIDVLIIDHVDYFDQDSEETDNSHMIKLMSTLRNINQLYGLCIIAVSHVRKTSGPHKDIPMMEDAIGSSSKFKQVKTVISFSPNPSKNNYNNGVYGTYISVLKTRAGSNSHMAASVLYDSRTNTYMDSYELFKLSHGKVGEQILIDPYWKGYFPERKQLGLDFKQAQAGEGLKKLVDEFEGTIVGRRS